MKPIVKKVLIGTGVAAALLTIITLVKPKKDKFGNVITIGATRENGHNIIQNGSAAPGYILPGTLSLSDGIYIGTGGDNRQYYFDGTQWVLVA